MKSLLKRLLKPLVQKIEGRLGRTVEAAVRTMLAAELERAIQPSLEATVAAVHSSCDRTEEIVAYLRRSSQENTLLLDSLVRELVRLQMQVDELAASLPAGNDAHAEEVMLG
jgi:hypothetical protein